MMTAFRQGLKEAGYVEGHMWRSNTAGRKDITIGCRRWQPISRSPTSGRDRHGRTPAALAAKAARSTIPIVINVGISLVEGH
jgi:hypothetical protein